MTTNPRQVACDLLHQVMNEGGFSNKLIQTKVDQSPMSDLDKRFVRNLVYGIIEKSMTLDYWIEQLSSVRLKKIEPKTLIILKMALYQIAFMEKVPESAAVNEAVKLTKKANFKSTGFVNGILRSFLRLEGKWPYPDEAKDPVRFLSVSYSHPIWLVERWIALYGKEAAEKLMAADNEVPIISLRCNTLKTTRDELIKSLEDADYTAIGHGLIPDAVLLHKMGVTPLHQLDAFEKGHFFVQDLSAMLVGHVVGPLKGELILDMCAAPGGKSTHLAQLMEDQGEILARDVNLFKTKQVDENLQRMGISCVTTEVGDALIFNENDIEKYDKLILDAPCSGLGIIRRKPEIRYNRVLSDLHQLSEIQKKMLENAAKYVKSGGSLIYSTCTIDPIENDEVLGWFLETHPDYYLADLPESLRSLSEDGKVLKMYQSIEGFDGFYIAKLIHNK